MNTKTTAPITDKQLRALLDALRECITDNDSACLNTIGTRGHGFCLRRIQHINQIARDALKIVER